jgi:hypothetical protein
MSNLNSNLFNDDDSSMEFLTPKQRNSDGIYRPSLDDAKDKRDGYKATIRFIKNLKQDGTLGPSAVEKHLHYVKLHNHPELIGYYDCKKNFDSECPLCQTYWRLSKSNNAADQEKADLLKRNTKYYSYVLILEDENHPELVGTIMVFSYGYKIREKINAQWKGEVDGKKCNVFDFANGKDFRLIIKENKTPEGTFPNYDSSQFLEKSPIKINGKPIPVEYNAELQKNVITDAKIQEGLQKFLLKRDHNLEEYESAGWSEEVSDKVQNIIAVITGDDVYRAKSNISSNSTTKTNDSTPGTFNDNDNLFNDSPDSGSSVDDFFNVG